MCHELDDGLRFGATREIGQHLLEVGDVDLSVLHDVVEEVRLLSGCGPSLGVRLCRVEHLLDVVAYSNERADRLRELLGLCALRIHHTPPVITMFATCGSLTATSLPMRGSSARSSARRSLPLLRWSSLEASVSRSALLGALVKFRGDTFCALLDDVPACKRTRNVYIRARR